ncbi:UNVERIFIED_CONTAM: hypothetical protein GTU68_053866 [Idotea baltica]|nr:hypothetical protein [Idotea baltica]
MQTSYLTYAMSVIISRALPDVRDGLKPSQRRILVAMNDLNLGPGGSRKKCAKIAGDTSGNYHPHGEGGIYPTLVRMAQDWVMREVLIDKQGNFGSLAGLPPAAMRYTEAKLSSAASEMLRDIDRDTVDYVATYDNSNMEPTVLPARFPNLIVNGSNGIAVGMATSIPPHNMAEVCEAVKLIIETPDVSLDELMEAMPAPDFPTGGIICGRMGVRQAYMTGRATITLRAKTRFETEKKSDVIVVTEIPYQETRDRIREKLELLVRDERIEGISRIVDLTDRTIPVWQVRLHIVLKKDADKEVVLNQLYQFSPLQTTVSMILLALDGNRPKLMTIRGMLDAFVRHRVEVIRRRTEFLLREARRRKHTVEGLLLAQIDIDRIIKTIRDSASRAAARDGVREDYSLSPNQAEAIVSMQLGSLANLEREKLQGEHGALLKDIEEYVRILSDEAHVRSIIRDDMEELQLRYSDKRRTLISDEELGDYDKEALIAEETMVVTLSRRGYIKRTPLTTYESQRRGGKGIKGATSDEADPIEHLFVSSTHNFLLFFTDRGKVHWLKVYDLPLQNRTAKGRALVNMIAIEEGENVSNCFSVREFPDDQFLMIATKKGIVKKTALSAYGRPQKGGIIAIRLDDDDALVDVRILEVDQDVMMSTSGGMAIRFNHDDARPMGRATRGVKGISLIEGEEVVGMVVADPTRTLLTVCEKGYGKRTTFGTYRRQKRGGKGLRDIKTTDRNGMVVDALSVKDDDDVLMVTAKGKIQRLKAADISVIGRNTQGVRIMKMSEGDTVSSCAVIASEDIIVPPDADAAEGDVVAEGGVAVEGTVDAAAGDVTAETTDASPVSDAADGSTGAPEAEPTDDDES